MSKFRNKKKDPSSKGKSVWARSEHSNTSSHEHHDEQHCEHHNFEAKLNHRHKKNNHSKFNPQLYGEMDHDNEVHDDHDME